MVLSREEYRREMAEAESQMFDTLSVVVDSEMSNLEMSELKKSDHKKILKAVLCTIASGHGIRL